MPRPYRRSDYDLDWMRKVMSDKRWQDKAWKVISWRWRYERWRRAKTIELILVLAILLWLVWP